MSRPNAIANLQYDIGVKVSTKIIPIDIDYRLAGVAPASLVSRRGAGSESRDNLSDGGITRARAAYTALLIIFRPFFTISERMFSRIIATTESTNTQSNLDLIIKTKEYVLGWLGNRAAFRQ